MWGSWRWAVMITTSSMPWWSQLARSSFYGTMEGLSAQRAGTGVRRPIRLRKAVVEGRSHHQAEATGKVECDALGDECVRAEGQVWSVVVKRANGKDQARITGEQATNFGPRKAVQP